MQPSKLPPESRKKPKVRADEARVGGEALKWRGRKVRTRARTDKTALADGMATAACMDGRCCVGGVACGRFCMADLCFG